MKTTSSGLRWPFFVFLSAVALSLYWPTVVAIATRWLRDPTYSHGFLVLAASMWMTWRVWRRAELEDTRPSMTAILMLFISGLLWIVASAATIDVLQELLVLTTILLAAASVFGWGGFRSLLIPIGVVFLVMPIWDYARLPLQGLTTTAVGAALHMIGIPAVISGHFVEIPSGTFKVAEGCSGLHFFMAASSLSLIQAYLYIRSTFRKVILITCALVVSLLANWIRVGAIIVVGHATDMSHPLISDHFYFGWVVFLILMIPVILLGHRIGNSSDSPKRAYVDWRLPGSELSVILIIILAMVAPPAYWSWISSTRDAARPPVLPESVGNWVVAGPARSDWQPVYPAAEIMKGCVYSDKDTSVDVWFAYYPVQTATSELIGYGNKLARPADGEISDNGLPGELLLRRRGRANRVLAYRYNMGGNYSYSTTLAKIDQTIARLQGNSAAFVLILSAECDVESCENASARVDSLLKDLQSIN